MIFEFTHFGDPYPKENNFLKVLITFLEPQRVPGSPSGLLFLCWPIQKCKELKEHML